MTLQLNPIWKKRHTLNRANQSRLPVLHFLAFWRWIGWLKTAKKKTTQDGRGKLPEFSSLRFLCLSLSHIPSASVSALVMNPTARGRSDGIVRPDRAKNTQNIPWQPLVAPTDQGLIVSPRTCLWNDGQKIVNRLMNQRSQANGLAIQPELIDGDDDGDGDE